MQFELDGLQDEGIDRSHGLADNISRNAHNAEDQTNIEVQEHQDIPGNAVLHHDALSTLYSTEPNARKHLSAFGNKNVTSIKPMVSTAGPDAAEDEPANPSLTEKGMSRLAMIGLAVVDLAFFIGRLIGHRWQYIYRRPGHDGWISAGKKYLTDWLVVRHLAGDIVVGTGSRWDNQSRDLRTSYVLVDLDNNGDEADLRARFRRVTAALGPASYVIRSSESGGVHVYYLLTRAEPLHALRAFGGRNGDVMHLLDAEGMREENGRVEVYPRGQYKNPERGQQTRNRAPFGIGSCLLDPVTLAPITEPGPASLIRARTMFERGEIRLVDPMEWAAKRTALPRAVIANSPPPPADGKPKGKRPRVADMRKRAVRNAPSGHDAAKVERWLTYGLTSWKELNKASGALAFYFRFVLGLSREEATARLLEWLETHHNGKSRTYNASPARARTHVTGVVERVYRRAKAKSARPRTEWVTVRGLSEFEARTVLTSLDRPSETCDPATGEELDRYKLQSYAFELLRLAKQYVLTVISAAINGTGEQAIPETVMVTVWPDRTRPEFVVPMPVNLREGRARSGTGFIKGIGRDRRWPLWRAIKQAGLFRLRQPALNLPWVKRWALYLVRLDFGAFSVDGAEFPNLDVALVRLLSSGQRRAGFTDYRCRKLAKGESVRAAVGADHDAARQARDLIVRLLREGEDENTGSDVDAA